jgi:hypothetical protein
MYIQTIEENRRRRSGRHPGGRLCSPPYDQENGGFGYADNTSLECGFLLSAAESTLLLLGCGGRCHADDL